MSSVQIVMSRALAGAQTCLYWSFAMAGIRLPAMFNIPSIQPHSITLGLMAASEL